MTELINRDNYLDVQEYLDHYRRVEQCSEDTIKRKWGYLRHLLEWGGETRFYHLEKKRFTFPNYLQTARNDRINKPLSPLTTKRNCLEVQEFYKWAKIYATPEYKKVSTRWIDTLRISRARNNLVGLEDRQYYTLEEALEICAIKPINLMEMRDQAAFLLMYLTGIRITALMTMPIKCLDIKDMTLYQLPQEGMRTKNNKAATTILLPIEPLIEVVNNYDVIIRKELGPDDLWYPNLSTDGLRWSPNRIKSQSESRRKSFRRGLKKLCKNANIEYKSSHKIRRGHGVYGVKKARNYEEFQAYSQNMGHEDPGTTFKFYSRLSHDNVKDTILRNK